MTQRLALQTAFNKGRMAYHKATSSPYVGWSPELDSEFDRGYRFERERKRARAA